MMMQNTRTRWIGILATLAFLTVATYALSYMTVLVVTTAECEKAKMDPYVSLDLIPYCIVEVRDNGNIVLEPAFRMP